MQKCLGWTSAHKFQPRYDEIPISDTLGEIDIIGDENERGAYYFCRDVYVQDVCVKCGIVVKR